MPQANNGSQASEIDLQQDVIKVKEALAQTAQDVKSKAEELFHQSVKDAKNKTTDVQENVVSYIKDNPLKSIAFSVLTGIVIAKLLS